MFDQMKPGHVIRFGVDPSTIIPMNIDPGSVGHAGQNKLETLWPGANHLGTVQIYSHSSGAIGDIAAEVANSQRGGLGIGRKLSYSALGRSHMQADRPLGAAAGDFVGYVDGQSNYIASTSTVFSKDFSGCLLVAYIVNGERRVAHAAASAVPVYDCKQEFLNTLHGMNAQLLGWFKPYVDATDGALKIKTIQKYMKYIGNQPEKMVTFGVITPANQAYSFDAFKPKGLHGNDWVITNVTQKTLSQSWNVH